LAFTKSATEPTAEEHIDVAVETEVVQAGFVADVFLGRIDLHLRQSLGFGVGIFSGNELSCRAPAGTD
jgi:hypothetical protein